VFELIGQIVSAGILFLVGGIVVALLLLMLVALGYYAWLWIPAYMCGADVSLLSLVGMSFRQVRPSRIVTAKIMVTTAGLSIERKDGITTAQLEAHVLAGGDVVRVVRAIIAASRAGMDLDFDRAAAIDLAGRDILDAVQISISPRVIDCPDVGSAGTNTLSGVAKDGVELQIQARVTVRTNLNRLVGGTTEETIVARVGQGIVSSIGAAATYMEVMSTPDRISQSVIDRGLDANSAFDIVSIDIAQIAVGENIGARLQINQADADIRIAQAQAEVRRAAAIACQQEMKAQVAASEASLVLAEAEIPPAVARAFRAGNFYVRPRFDAELKTDKTHSREFDLSVS
jgi:uncharacterized protein YqfA (UPF0365 family)